MAMTSEQMIEFFGQQARASLAALDLPPVSSSPHMIALNLSEVFKCHLMQGLIGWRTGLTSPVEPFKAAVAVMRTPAKRPDNLSDLPLEQAAIVSFLINEPPLEFACANFIPERSLDAVLGMWLKGAPDMEAWNTALAQLRENEDAALAVETYETYALLLAGDGPMKELISKAELLFKKRGRNSYYSGGLQTDGGGPDNPFTVDYRLAAILKKIGYKDGIHAWRWQ